MKNSKEQALYLKFLRTAVLKHYNCDFITFKSQSETSVFFKALKVIPTTKKAICKAFNLNIDSMCRRKRMFEIEGKLQESRKNIICPYSGKYAKLLTRDNTLFNSKIFGYE